MILTRKENYHLHPSSLIGVAVGQRTASTFSLQSFRRPGLNGSLNIMRRGGPASARNIHEKDGEDQHNKTKTKLGIFLPSHIMKKSFVSGVPTLFLRP